MKTKIYQINLGICREHEESKILLRAYVMAFEMPDTLDTIQEGEKVSLQHRYTI